MTENGKTDLSLGLVILTVLLTVYCQLIVKWRVLLAGSLPVDQAGTLPDLTKKVFFLIRLLFDPWIISCMLAALLAGLSWMGAMTRIELSYAYPFMSLAFILVLALSAFFFQETMTTPKVLGMIVVIVGLIIASQG